uniref:C2H2-type domain-containing protein n=1 Tax=Trichogramma kaykai TaxID=54128 RepID=A0ABD2X6N1_9HYME
MLYTPQYNALSVDNKQYVSGIRPNAFTLESNMMIHRDTIHNDEKNYACHKCEKKFEFRSHLSRHQISVHKDRKNLSCNNFDAVVMMTKQ